MDRGERIERLEAFKRLLFEWRSRGGSRGDIEA
jgi:hypothetical protein